MQQVIRASRRRGSVRLRRATSGHHETGDGDSCQWPSSNHGDEVTTLCIRWTPATTSCGVRQLQHTGVPRGCRTRTAARANRPWREAARADLRDRDTHDLLRRQIDDCEDDR